MSCSMKENKHSKYSRHSKKQAEEVILDMARCKGFGCKRKHCARRIRFPKRGQVLLAEDPRQGRKCPMFLKDQECKQMDFQSAGALMMDFLSYVETEDRNGRGIFKIEMYPNRKPGVLEAIVYKKDKPTGDDTGWSVENIVEISYLVE